MSMRRASSSLAITWTTGRPTFFFASVELELPLARGVELADITERVRPVTGDRGEVRPSLLRAIASGLGDGARLGGGLLEEGLAGIGPATTVQRIGEVAQAGPARLARRRRLGRRLKMRDQRRQQARLPAARAALMFW